MRIKALYFILILSLLLPGTSLGLGPSSLLAGAQIIELRESAIQASKIGDIDQALTRFEPVAQYLLAHPNQRLFPMWAMIKDLDLLILRAFEQDRPHVAEAALFLAEQLISLYAEKQPKVRRRAKNFFPYYVKLIKAYESRNLDYKAIYPLFMRGAQYYLKFNGSETFVESNLNSLDNFLYRFGWFITHFNKSYKEEDRLEKLFNLLNLEYVILMSLNGNQRFRKSVAFFRRDSNIVAKSYFQWNQSPTEEDFQKAERLLSQVGESYLQYSERENRFIQAYFRFYQELGSSLVQSDFLNLAQKVTAQLKKFSFKLKDKGGEVVLSRKTIFLLIALKKAYERKDLFVEAKLIQQEIDGLNEIFNKKPSYFQGQSEVSSLTGRATSLLRKKKIKEASLLFDQAAELFLQRESLSEQEIFYVFRVGTSLLKATRDNLLKFSQKGDLKKIQNYYDMAEKIIQKLNQLIQSRKNDQTVKKQVQWVLSEILNFGETKIKITSNMEKEEELEELSFQQRELERIKIAADIYLLFQISEKLYWDYLDDQKVNGQAEWLISSGTNLAFRFMREGNFQQPQEVLTKMVRVIRSSYEQPRVQKQLLFVLRAYHLLLVKLSHREERGAYLEVAAEVASFMESYLDRSQLSEEQIEALEKLVVNLNYTTRKFIDNKKIRSAKSLLSQTEKVLVNLKETTLYSDQIPYLVKLHNAILEYALMEGDLKVAFQQVEPLMAVLNSVPQDVLSDDLAWALKNSLYQLNQLFLDFYALGASQMDQKRRFSAIETAKKAKVVLEAASALLYRFDHVQDVVDQATQIGKSFEKLGDSVAAAKIFSAFPKPASAKRRILRFKGSFRGKRAFAVSL